MKKKVVVISISLLIGITVGIFVYEYSKARDEKKINNDTNNIVDNLAVINKLYDKDNLELMYYDAQTNAEHYKYTGSDISYLKKLIEDTYVRGFSEYGSFTYKDNTIYVVIPRDCNVKTISKEDVKVYDEKDDSKTIDIGGTMHALVLNGGVWKLDYPYVWCESFSLEGNNEK